MLAPGLGGPRPLRLDASGREVDEAGNVIQAVRVPVASSLVRRASHRRAGYRVCFLQLIALASGSTQCVWTRKWERAQAAVEAHYTCTAV